MSSKLLHLVFYAIVVLFLAWYVNRLDFTTFHDIGLATWPLIAGTALALGFRYTGVATWIQVLKGLGANRMGSVAEMSFIYAKAWLGRYIPGKITWILGKIYFASELGIAKRELAVSSVFEGALQVAIVMFLSLCLLVVDPRLDVFSIQQKLLISTGSLLLLILMLPVIFNRLISTLYRQLKGEALPRGTYIDHATFARAFALTSLGFVLTGGGYFFLTMAIYPDLTYDHIFFVAGVFNLAGAIGIASIFAPSGLGVRESVQLVLLPLIMAPEIALVVTVAARMWSVCVDLLFFGMTWGLKQLSGRSHLTTGT